YRDKSEVERVAARGWKLSEKEKTTQKAERERDKSEGKLLVTTIYGGPRRHTKTTTCSDMVPIEPHPTLKMKSSYPLLFLLIIIYNLLSIARKKIGGDSSVTSIRGSTNRTPDSGTDVNVQDIDIRTVLHVASCQRFCDVAELLKEGADVDPKDHWGST
ncbi:hypothetical protein M8C21_010295, partial [Ambrosia artemisiifolia]